MSSQFCVVYITAPPGRVARGIAKKIVDKRLAACVNIVPAVESRYWWKGKTETAREALLVVKTVRRTLPKLTAFVNKIHPYSVPEIIALPIVSGNKAYLAWLKNETR